MKEIMKSILFTVMYICMSTAIAGSPKQPVENVLDQLHNAASKADSKLYFSLFAKDSVYIGTDAKETWTIKEFKEFAEPYFSKGKGWTYTANNRHIYFSKNGDVAWFDELLWNEKYGECRGTGVLVLEGKQWKIAQYHLTIPIPNELAGEVVQKINISKH